MHAGYWLAAVDIVPDTKPLFHRANTMAKEVPARISMRNYVRVLRSFLGSCLSIVVSTP